MTEVKSVVGLGAFLPCPIQPMDTGDSLYLLSLCVCVCVCPIRPGIQVIHYMTIFVFVFAYYNQNMRVIHYKIS